MVKSIKKEILKNKSNEILKIVKINIYYYYTILY